MRRSLGCLVAIVVALCSPGRADPLHLLPQPRRVAVAACRAPGLPRTIAADFDGGARELLSERWAALGIPVPRASASDPDITATIVPAMRAQEYRLDVRGSRVRIRAGSPAGAFYAAMTLAQLPMRGGTGWSVPCVTISDWPALPWRILSDDVSRGPLPTMRYFKERIRTIAAFKMNGYSPYMEHVFVSPTDPLPAPLDGITPAQLRELDAYARRVHVALIPEQQTFAHMHGVLSVEQYAPAAELPHGFLLSPASPVARDYLARVVTQELAAVPNPPFFHIGSDETATLGLGTTSAYVQQTGKSRAYADHVAAMDALVAPSGARVMLWDDGIENDPSIAPLLPRPAGRAPVIVNWHYGPQTSYQPFIDLVARSGFDQMIAPGANNWNEIFPDVATAVPNEDLFISQGKGVPGVIGVFQTVWHDDGETLYESTWYPVLYAAASAWEEGRVDRARFDADFPVAFFGTDDPAYAGDVALLGDAVKRLHAAPHDTTDALFWADPFDAAAEARMDGVDLRAVRLDAETVERDLYDARPPLHENAAFVTYLAARRLDALARKFQIAREVRAMYADAQANAGVKDGPAIRDLFWSRYWMWELRDSYESLAPLYERAWRYESREGHLASNLERYHLAAQRAIALADAIYRATYDGYVRSGTLPAFDGVVK